MRIQNHTSVWIAGLVLLFSWPTAAQVQLECPAVVLSQAELTSIVEAAREVRSDLPERFALQTTRVRRERCLYYVIEVEEPGTTGQYNIFLIDPLGELVDGARRALPPRPSQ